MALIEHAKGRRAKQSPSGYTRLFGIAELGNLMSRVQGATISAGTELEKLIWERVRQIEDLDKFIEETRGQTDKTGYWVACKKQVKESQIISSKYEPDFLAFDVSNRICYPLEVKDGDQFDTKKASGEHTTLHNFSTDVANTLPFSVKIYLCAFNARTRDEIFHGLKGKFGKDQLLTGKEFCDLFGVDFEGINKIRTSDHQSNLDYFINAELEIPAIKAMILKRLNSSKS